MKSGDRPTVTKKGRNKEELPQSALFSLSVPFFPVLVSFFSGQKNFVERPFYGQLLQNAIPYGTCVPFRVLFKTLLKKYVNISIAVDTEKGLLVPVLKNADKKSIIDISIEITELTELAEKAREGKLSPDEMKGGNFTISNLGGIGGTQFTPVISPPQVAILGVSRAGKKPVFLEGKFGGRNILPLSLSYDHRLIDGAEGVRFIDWIAPALEDPYSALLET